MKRILFGSFVAVWLCSMLAFALSAQPCTPVNKISSFLYTAFFLGEQNTMELRAEYGSIYLNGVFTVTSGTLPPGLSLIGNKITGIPNTVGTYTFSIGASSAPGCPIFQRTFTIKIVSDLPCSEFAITSTSNPPTSSTSSGSIVFKTEHFDSVQYTVVTIPPRFSFSHVEGSAQAIVSGMPYPGLNVIVLAAQSNKGCRDTIRFEWYVQSPPCLAPRLDSITPRGPKLLYGIMGIPYDQFFSTGLVPSITMTVSEGSLPPGLTFENRRITGTPSATGIYHFKLRVTGRCSESIEQAYYIEVVPPNTICKSYDAIAPTPAEVSATTYYVKKKFSIMFSASRSGVVDDSAQFVLTEGYLPDGITLNGNILSGAVDYERNWNFTIGAFSKDGCPYYQQQYSIQFILEKPCDAFNIVTTWGEPGFTMVGVNMFSYIGISSVGGDFDSATFEAVHLPPGFQAEPSYYQIHVFGHALHVGYDEFVIAATTPEGCQDTLVVGLNFTCPFPQPIYPEPKDIGYLHINEAYYQSIGFESPYINFDADYDNFRFEITEGALPPGITLSDTTLVWGYLHGTPTTAGTYPFTVTAMIETCAITEQAYTFVVREPVPFKSLTIYAECSEDISYKKWRINNPNNFNIPITYQPYYFYNYGPINHVATPGNSYIILGTYNSSEPSLPYTVQVKWVDGDGTPRSLLKSASTELCNPPACAYASDIVTLHQGLTKSGYSIDLDLSRTVWALGTPDSQDEYWPSIRSYSLGYNGFIVLRMSSAIYNEPGNDFMVYEYSYGEPAFAKNPERAEVQISQNGTNWVSLGLTTPSSCQGTLDHAFDIAGKLPWFRYVKVIDKTDRNARILNGACSPTAVFAFDGVSDGFDLDAVTCINSSTLARKDVQEEESSFNSTSVLYPNPVKDWLTVDLSEENIATDKQIELHVIDLSGNSRYRNIHSLEPNGTTQLKVSELRTGMYILRVQTAAGHSRFYKFLKD
ncbi:putative Ig domain-containing protein [Ohtaekwangia kribbensis]|uniref:Ig domain-containing protein n=1 Tax=Ohtaekwangia kribbensis TaxID=688913 RepID=A0ABW3K442_9BACT